VLFVVLVAAALLGAVTTLFSGFVGTRARTCGATSRCSAPVSGSGCWASRGRVRRTRARPHGGPREPPVL